MDMTDQFRLLDHEIERQPMPRPYSSWTANISCNDCYAKSTVPFHFLGLCCPSCGSYNTVQTKIIKPEESPESHDVEADVDDGEDEDMDIEDDDHNLGEEADWESDQDEHETEEREDSLGVVQAFWEWEWDI